ncbi:MAG: hypothetical protein ABIQ89_00915 [Candidatus Saccharimonadales bacterium]
MISDKSIKLFKKVAKEIPAYSAFLAEHHLKPADISSPKDFYKVPLTSKKNYLVPNALQDLVWKNDFNNLMLFCSTSGSTGKPYYFPRNEELSLQYSYVIEDFLKYSSYGKGPTLVLIGFGMGVWIGGIITLRAFEIAAARMNQPVSILPAGYNKKELFKALQELSPNFEQTVIVGYPPFIKELIDEASQADLNLAKLQIRLLSAAEAFTETFRKYVCENGGVQDPILDTMNIYGTADIGAMAYETPLSILARRLIIEDPVLFKDVFRQIEKTPTLAQFNPDFIEFEEVNGELALTGNAALPLIRYAVGDHGGVISYNEMMTKLKSYNINLEAEVKKYGIGHTVKKHPFVFVYERTDFAATLHGIIIYPEFIKEGLLKPKMGRYFTERFTMSTKTDVRHNQFLQINIELQPGLEGSEEIEKIACKAIRTSLIEKSSEFAEISKSKDSDQLIQVVLWPNGHERYFAAGIKQKWVEKS